MLIIPFAVEKVNIIIEKNIEYKVLFLYNKIKKPEDFI